MAELHRQTIGNVLMLEVNASPNGSITAPLGSLATDSTNGALWQNTDGGTTWVNMGLPGGAVLDTDYDAQTVIVAVSDDTPVAQTVGDSEFVGRAAGDDVGVMTATQARTVLNVEDGSTADQTGAEIKSAYEGEVNTNAFTDAEQSKLTGIEAAADVTDATNVLAALAASAAAKDIGGGDLTSVAEVSQKDHAAFTGSESIRTTAAIQTTDATVTTLLSIALADDSVYWVEAAVIARNTSADADNAYKIIASLSRRSAGAAVLGGAGSTNLFTDEEDLDWDAAWVASGNNAVLQVTGEAATTINWAATVKYQRVSGNS
jgi:hypothetical protein